MSGLEVTLAILCILAFFAGIAVGRLLLPELKEELVEGDSVMITDYEFSQSSVEGNVGGAKIEKLYAYAFDDPPTGFDSRVPHHDAKAVDRVGNSYSIDQVPKQTKSATSVFVAVWGTGCLSATGEFTENEEPAAKDET